MALTTDNTMKYNFLILFVSNLCMKFKYIPEVVCVASFFGNSSAPLAPLHPVLLGPWYDEAYASGACFRARFPALRRKHFFHTGFIIGSYRCAQIVARLSDEHLLPTILHLCSYLSTPPIPLLRMQTRSSYQYDKSNISCEYWQIYNGIGCETQGSQLYLFRCFAFIRCIQMFKSYRKFSFASLCILKCELNKMLNISNKINIMSYLL